MTGRNWFPSISGRVVSAAPAARTHRGQLTSPGPHRLVLLVIALILPVIKSNDPPEGSLLPAGGFMSRGRLAGKDTQLWPDYPAATPSSAPFFLFNIILPFMIHGLHFFIYLFFLTNTHTHARALAVDSCWKGVLSGRRRHHSCLFFYLGSI